MESPNYTPTFFDVLTYLPKPYKDQLEMLSYTVSAEKLAALRAAISFVGGGECPADAEEKTRSAWGRKQRTMLGQGTELKRLREIDLNQTNGGGPDAKRSKVEKSVGLFDPKDVPKFTLDSVRVSSPVQRKHDVTIRAHSIAFTRLGNIYDSEAVVATVPIASITRAFMLPVTRGQAKPLWSVILLTNDVPYSRRASPKHLQVVFSLEQESTGSWKTTTYLESKSDSERPMRWMSLGCEGEKTGYSIRRFLSFLPPQALPVLEASTEHFRSATDEDAPGVQAYLAAKPGTLWFLDEGILWTEAKPRQFWALEDLATGEDGVRVSATGQTCAVYVRRRVPDEEKYAGQETVFQMIDGAELNGIRAWIQKRRDMFGVKKVVEGSTKGEASSSTALVGE